MAKNLCNKERRLDKGEKPYEIWLCMDHPGFGGRWEWQVLKKWQADDDKEYAKWFVNVVTPIVPHGEMGDTYVADIKGTGARKVWSDAENGEDGTGTHYKPTVNNLDARLEALESGAAS